MASGSVTQIGAVISKSWTPSGGGIWLQNRAMNEIVIPPHETWIVVGNFYCSGTKVATWIEDATGRLVQNAGDTYGENGQSISLIYQNQGDSDVTLKHVAYGWEQTFSGVKETFTAIRIV